MTSAWATSPNKPWRTHVDAQRAGSARQADGSAHGGHLVEATVCPTLEVVLTELPGHLQRRLDPATGLTLIQPAA